MRHMPPEWFAGMRAGEQWPLFARMAPTVEADAADSIVAALPDACRATVAGADHGWAPADMADALVTHLREDR